MHYNGQTIFQFGSFTLDIDKGRLFDGAKDVLLRPKSFALLLHLVRNADRVVSKDELLSEIWTGVTVTEDSLTQCVHEVRRALGPEVSERLRTVPRRGYLFVAAGASAVSLSVEPTAIRQNALTEKGNGGPENAISALRHDGIAVLPFTLTVSGDPADAVLLDGLAHDVISRLARLRGFHVISRGSTFALRHLASDPQAAGRALKVAYAVAGTAEIQCEKFHLRFDLVQVEDGSILWTEDVTETRDQFLALLPKLSDRIVQALETQVTAAEAKRVRAMPVEALDAWENYHAGLKDALRFDPERIARAMERLRVATRLDPGFARAHAALSFCYYFRAFSGLAPDRAAEVALARRTAEDALQADDVNPSSHWAFGRALWLEGDPEGCLQHSSVAVGLSPSFALGHYMIGFVETHSGDAQRGLEQMDLVLSLSPFDPFLASMQITRAIALIRLGQLDQAATWARDATRQPNAYSTILAPAALILASAGRLPEARQIVVKLREAAPHFGSEQLHQSLYRMSDDVTALFRKNAPLVGL